MVAKPLCPLYKNIIKPLDRARYPELRSVLLMDWVDGETMEAYIAANYRNQSAMSMLSYRFGKMAAWLRTQSFSHGDIKPDKPFCTSEHGRRT